MTIESSGPSPEEHGTKAPDRGEEQYVVEGEKINLKWQTFEPTPSKEPALSFQPTVIFLSGIAMPTSASPELCQTFADDSSARSYSIDTPGSKVDHDAQAILQFIEERKLNNIVLAGNSLGGVEALYLAKFLKQERPNITVEGLVLIDSAGLYEQSALLYPIKHVADHVATRADQVKDMLTSKHDAEHFQKQFEYERSAAKHLLKEFGGIDQFMNNFFNNLSEATNKHPYLADIDVPVILMHGSKDLSFEPGKIIPNQNPSGAKPFIESGENIGDEGEYLGDQREAYLQQHLFTKSPYVRMVVAEKAGHHNLMYLRPDSVAHASLYLLDRYKRGLKE